MSKDSSYSIALISVLNLPKFSLGQEVITKDGKGIIVKLEMDFNGLYIEPYSSKAVVWYSTENSASRDEGGSWVTFTYNLNEINALPSL